jgi:hypothetical protein
MLFGEKQALRDQAVPSLHPCLDGDMHILDFVLQSASLAHTSSADYLSQAT